MPGTYIIVGASLAGATAAATLREEGFGGSLTLTGEARASVAAAQLADDGIDLAQTRWLNGEGMRRESQACRAGNTESASALGR